MNQDARALPVVRIKANNFAADSDNRIHSDEVAAEYGFPGALVPGVAIFAYLTQPVVAEWGRAWLERGRISARFLKPVVHDALVTVHGRREEESPQRIALELRDEAQAVLAVGSAELPAEPPVLPRAVDYPLQPLPASDQRLPARSESIVPGQTKLGSLSFSAAWQQPLEGPEPFVDAVRDPGSIYRGANAACHPALVVAWSNFLLMQNIDLGPWLHTGSTAQYFSLPQEGEQLTLRGHVTKVFEKRSHEFIEVDLVMFDADERPLARNVHTAIIRPARP